MKPIKIEFGKLEFGTRFLDPATKDYYTKISEREAEPESLDRYNRRLEWDTSPYDTFHPNEIVIVP